MRTFNFTQNRITDHRVNVSKFDMAAMMRGELLDDLIDALASAEEEEGLRAALAEGDSEAPPTRG